MKQIEGGVTAPKGFTAAGVHCGVKNNKTDKKDLALILSECECSAAAVYTRNRLNKNDYMDILARLYADKIEIDFRTLGNSFNPLAAVPEDIAENIRLLNGIASKLEYDYIMGMNCTRITIARKGAATA